MRSTLMYGFFLALAIVLIILGGVISGSASKTSDETAKRNIKNSSTGIITIGVIFFIGSSVGLYLEYNSAPKSLYF